MLEVRPKSLVKPKLSEERARLGAATGSILNRSCLAQRREIARPQPVVGRDDFSAVLSRGPHPEA
jgi:hypothetical protein